MLVDRSRAANYPGKMKILNRCRSRKGKPNANQLSPSPVSPGRQSCQVCRHTNPRYHPTQVCTQVQVTIQAGNCYREPRDHEYPGSALVPSRHGGTRIVVRCADPSTTAYCSIPPRIHADCNIRQGLVREGGSYRLCIRGLCNRYGISVEGLGLEKYILGIGRCLVRY
jgi:hypothetical protein